MIKMIKTARIIRMTDDYSRITIRLKPYEQETFSNLIKMLRERAGYDVPATDVVKSLMGFKTKLAALKDEDRAILRKMPEKKLNRA